MTSPTGFRMKSPHAGDTWKAMRYFRILVLCCIAVAPLRAGAASIGSVSDKSSPFTFRAIHIALVAPSNEIELSLFTKYVREAIRRAGAAGYTHAIFQCFGTYSSIELRAAPEAWVSQEEYRKNKGISAFSWPRDTIAALLDLCRKSGLRPVPEVASFGHMDLLAKHVAEKGGAIIYRQPKRSELFTPDGSVLDLTNPAIYPWLFSLYDEVIALFGNPDYFLVGTDEAWSYGRRKEEDGELLAKHLNTINRYLSKRKIAMIMWGDMLLEKGNPRFKGQRDLNGTPQGRTHEAIDKLDKNIIIADWHYYTYSPRFPSVDYFREHGFRIFAAPGPHPVNSSNFIRYAHAAGLQGIIQTTWHLLPRVLKYYNTIETAAMIMENPAMTLEDVYNKSGTRAFERYIRGRATDSIPVVHTVTKRQSLTEEFKDGRVYAEAKTNNHVILYQSEHGSVLGTDSAGVPAEAVYRIRLEGVRSVKFTARELAHLPVTHLYYRPLPDSSWTEMDSWRRGPDDHVRTLSQTVGPLPSSNLDFRIEVTGEMDLAQSGGLGFFSITASE